MSKYDFEVDLNLDSSTGMILSKIPSGSTVLEFGCAAGRMTRYMKNALGCHVYIVEYDKEAFDSAMQYAVDGVCDDILTLSWMDRFKEIEFDIILFVDVLEHLLRPGFALSSAAKLLKRQGKIYVSIPNIAHNDVLLKAFNNRFDYTDVGILDNTHMHFWGYENITPFAENNGLSVHSIKATYRPTGTTEQLMDASYNCPHILLNYFNERQFAEAYQFIIELGKVKDENCGKEKGKDICRKNYIASHIYIDDGDGFHAENVIEFESVNISSGRYVAHCVFSEVQNVQKLRFDPLEGQGCIIQNLSVRQGGKELECNYLDYLELSEGILLLGTDPKVVVELFDYSAPVIIDADIIICGEEYLDIVQQACIDQYSELRDLNQKLGCSIAENKKFQDEVDRINAENIALQGEVVRINTENRALQDGVDRINAENKVLQDEADRINAENNIFQGELAGYIHLANEKDLLLLKKDRLISEKDNLLIEKDNMLLEKDNVLTEKVNMLSEKNNVLAEKDNVLSEKDTYIADLESKVDYYRNRTCVKLFDKFWKVYWAIRLRLRKLIGKRENA